MPEYCFETINWGPYFGVERPDVPRLVRAAAAAGFEWISFEETLLAAYKEEGGSLADLRRMVADEGLSTLAIHAIAIGDDAKAAAELARPLAEAAEGLGAGFVQAGCTAAHGPRLLEATQAVVDLLKPVDAALAIEFLPFLEIATIDQTRRVLAELDAPGSGIVVDTWHFFHGPDDWAELASLSKDEISFLQFDDHPALASDDLLEETTQRRVYPGDGVFELDRFAETLRGIGFDGVIGLELLSAEHRAMPVEGVARELIESSRRFWEGAAD